MHHVLQICLYSNQAIVLSEPIILCHSTLFFGSSALSICFASSSTLQTVILIGSWWPAKMDTTWWKEVAKQTASVNVSTFMPILLRSSCSGSVCVCVYVCVCVCRCVCVCVCVCVKADHNQANRVQTTVPFDLPLAHLKNTHTSFAIWLTVAGVPGIVTQEMVGAWRRGCITYCLHSSHISSYHVYTKTTTTNRSISPSKSA